MEKDLTRNNFDFSLGTWLQSYLEHFAVCFRCCRFHLHNSSGILNQLEKKRHNVELSLRVWPSSNEKNEDYWRWARFQQFLLLLKASDFHSKMSVPLLMIKISQLALESLDCFCKKTPSRKFIMNLSPYLSLPIPNYSPSFLTGVLSRSNKCGG